MSSMRCMFCGLDYGSHANRTEQCPSGDEEPGLFRNERFVPDDRLPFEVWKNNISRELAEIQKPDTREFEKRAEQLSTLKLPAYEKHSQKPF